MFTGWVHLCRGETLGGKGLGNLLEKLGTTREPESLRQMHSDVELYRVFLSWEGAGAAGISHQEEWGGPGCSLMVPALGLSDANTRSCVQSCVRR